MKTTKTSDTERVDKWMRGLKDRADLPGETMVKGPLSILRLLANEVERSRGRIEVLESLINDVKPLVYMGPHNPIWDRLEILKPETGGDDPTAASQASQEPLP